MRAITLCILLILGVSSALAQARFEVFLATESAAETDGLHWLTGDAQEGKVLRWGQPTRSWPMKIGQLAVSSKPQDHASPPRGYYGIRGSVSPAEATGRTEIRLEQATFDPLVESPGLPASLAGFSRPGAESDYFLVQFTGPIRPAWRQALELSGLEVLEYVPDFAYLVRGPADVNSQLRQIDSVRWVGSFLPAYRLASHL